MTMMQARSWIDFFDCDHPIYVNARHKQVHYEALARDIGALIAAPGAALLDYGCGEALAAPAIARRSGRLYLYDAAPNVRDTLTRHFGGEPKIEILTGEGLQALPEGALDMITVNSVLQYVPGRDLEQLLDLWAAKLKPGGRLILADIIPPGLGMMADIKALLHMAWRGGFLFAAVGGLLRTFVSDYRRLRNDLGLMRYRAEDLRTLVERHGFEWGGELPNLGHNPNRLTFATTRTGLGSVQLHPARMP